MSTKKEKRPTLAAGLDLDKVRALEQMSPGAANLAPNTRSLEFVQTNASC